MFDLNDDIKNFVNVECSKLKFSMDQVTNLGKSIHFLALTSTNDDMLKLQKLHSFLIYTNGICDDLHDNMTRLADERYEQYLSGIPYDLSADQVVRLGNPSQLEWAVIVTEQNFAKMKSLFEANDTKNAIETAELKKLKISNEIIKLSTAVKEIRLKTEPLMEINKIKSDFLENVQKMAGDLETHVQTVLKLDDLLVALSASMELIINAQKGLPMEIALSFIV